MRSHASLYSRCLYLHLKVWVWGARQLGQRLRADPSLRDKGAAYMDLVVQQSLEEAIPTVHRPRWKPKATTKLDLCPTCYPTPADLPVRPADSQLQPRTNPLGVKTCCANPVDAFSPCLPSNASSADFNRDVADLVTDGSIHEHTQCCFKYTRRARKNGI